MISTEKRGAGPFLRRL